MASFPCPYCGRAVDSEADDVRLEQCPHCDGRLILGYRYQLIGARGKVSGGTLYEAVDGIFGDSVAVLFADKPEDRGAAARFVEGHRLFAELGGGRGLVKLRELGHADDHRPHAVMDWFGQGTLDNLVRAKGPLDQATLLEFIGDLLVGLSKAHRSMPTLIHGHIHPGKIGFVNQHQAVLFGFEWAKQVFEQDSHLADAFVTTTEPTGGPSRASDLRQLAISIYFAASGEWIASEAVSSQRARIAQRLDGPLAAFLDRMLCAGVDGYRSAVEASADFEHLIAGTSRWQSRVSPREQDRSGDLDAGDWQPTDADDDDEDDDYEQVDEDELEVIAPSAKFEDALADIYESEAPRSKRAPVMVTPASMAATHGQFGSRSGPPSTSAKAPSVKPGRVVGVLIASMVAFGMCTAAIVEDASNDRPPPPRVRGLPNVEPIQQPPPPIIVDPPQHEAGYEPEPAPEPAPELIPEVPFVTHHFSGTVTGPEPDDVGTPCEVWVEPVDAGSNCRFYIDCGKPKRRIYGGGTVGFADCTLDSGAPVYATDEDQDAPDGAFVALLQGDEPMVMVEDRWLLPPKRVLIKIESGGAHPGPVPDVRLARRMTREDIEAAIERGELPEL